MIVGLQTVVKISVDSGTGTKQLEKQGETVAQHYIDHTPGQVPLPGLKFFKVTDRELGR